MAEFADKTHTDVSLWDALELREPMEGLSKGAHGYVIGWTGSAYELKINNRVYEVLPHQAKHKERPPLDGADEEIKKEFGNCPLCEDKTMTVADPYYACCGGQICERCADLLDLHRLSKRKCPLCGKGVEGPSRDSSTQAHAVVCRRRAKKGDARAHFALAAMEAVLSEEEQARHLLLLVDEGFAEVCGGVLLLRSCRGDGVVVARHRGERRGDGVVVAAPTPSTPSTRGPPLVVNTGPVHLRLGLHRPRLRVRRIAVVDLGRAAGPRPGVTTAERAALRKRAARSPGRAVVLRAGFGLSARRVRAW